MPVFAFWLSLLPVCYFMSTNIKVRARNECRNIRCTFCVTIRLISR